MHSYKDTRTLEYLATIAIRNNLDLSEFFDCIKEAYAQEKSELKQISVRCRQKKENSAVFLFTVEEDVIAQFPISTRILESQKQLKNHMRAIFAVKLSAKKVMNPKIEDLKAGMKNVNLTAKVIVTPKPNTVYTRYGTEAYVSNALISDGTGSIRIALWNQQISMVSKGDLIKIENGEVGEVSSFKGELQLRTGRNGRLSVIK